MNVAIINLTGGGLSYGYITYLSAVLPRMLADPRVSRLRVYVPRGFASRFTDLMPSDDLRECDDSRAGRRQLRREILQMAPDVAFFPSNRWLDLGRIPSVAMVQSMLPLVMPGGGNGWLDLVKNLVRARLIRIACQRANRVIAISNYVQDFLVEAWRIPPARLGMVYHGVNPPPAIDALPAPPAVPPAWQGRFLFTAGSMHPYRALEDVIRALAILAAQGMHPPVVMAGGVELDRTQRPYLQKMKALAAKLGVQAQIAWSGHLEAAEMSWCYYHCQVFLMTSRVEACPNIALEAMSHGAVCLAADNPPLPEFFQAAARYYRPKCGEALAQAIGAALTYPPAETEGFRQRARTRAGDFTWEKTTQLTVHELEKAANMLYS